ncbi:MAG: TIM barrel protein [bacterium]|nr:TIM barrel protein [bacterium]
MILGFKTGPKNFAEGQKIVTDLGASMCEVWFNVNKHEEYTEMLSWLIKHNVYIGLHYWGVVDGNIKPNLATQNEHIRNETMNQIRHTIDIAADIRAVYVNIHPGAQAIETINLTNWEQSLTSNPITPLVDSTQLLLTASKELDEYARTKNILLTIESLPGRETSMGRGNIYNAKNTSLATLELLAQKGIRIANDITHSASQFLVDEQDVVVAWKQLMDFSTRIASQTRLLHINTITPPYNGTDSHDGITDADFAHETFPIKQGLQEFLTLFKDRDDVYVVNEPKTDHMGNYQALLKLAEGI